MTAPTMVPALSDQGLVAAILETAAAVDQEIEAARRLAECPDASAWHRERARRATTDLLSLINHPQHRASWDRIEARVAPAWPLRSAGAGIEGLRP